FVQAEDGIRDFHVTGVQTCALPIFGDGGEVGTGQLHLKHAGLAAKAEEVEFKVTGGLPGEIDLGDLGGGLEPEQVVAVRLAAAGKVGDLELALDAGHEEVFHDGPVDVGAAEEVVAVMADDRHGA